MFRKRCLTVLVTVLAGSLLLQSPTTTSAATVGCAILVTKSTVYPMVPYYGGSVFFTGSVTLTSSDSKCNYVLYRCTGPLVHEFWRTDMSYQGAGTYDVPTCEFYGLVSGNWVAKIICRGYDQNNQVIWAASSPERPFTITP
jgi:hypothetical protein